jgi:predicted GNAT superfamily acetyltransferase
MVSLRILDSIPDFEKVVDLEIAVWGLNPRDAVPANLLHVVVPNGGLLIGAYDGDHLVGLAYAFPIWRGGKRLLWSHMAGVHPDFQGQGIGFSLKQAQRQWALERGYKMISWTFDPLLRGNANFNLHLLGATAISYHLDYYGEMTDSINAGLPSDRLEVQWNLRSRRVKALASRKTSSVVGDCPDKHFALRAKSDGRPLLDDSVLRSNTRHLFVEIPFDVGRLKKANQDIALEWRLALRRVLQDKVSRGMMLVDFVTLGERCWYVLSSPGTWYLYVLACSDESLYTGVTSDLERRVVQHNAGQGASYTASRRPVQLVGAWAFPGRSRALRAEVSFKRQTRQAKLKCVREQLAFEDALFVDLGS